MKTEKCLKVEKELWFFSVSSIGNGVFISNVNIMSFDFKREGQNKNQNIL
jgi:hypothetical protein